MRLLVAVLIVTLSCGLVKPDPGARTFDFAVASQEGFDVVQEGPDQHKASGVFDVGDDHPGYVTTSEPTTFKLLSLPSLPSLPALPPLPALPALPALPNPLFPPRSTITATKTIYAEVTQHVTRHPVCLTVRGVKRPCLPVNQHSGSHDEENGPGCWKHGDGPEEESVWNDDQLEGLYIQPTSVVRIPSATSQPTASQEAQDTPEVEPSRDGRYLEFGRDTPTPPTTTSSDDAARLLNRPPETHFATQTLWVTRVLHVTDYRVTATLEAKNCVPIDLKVPFCPQRPPLSAITTPPHKLTKPPQLAASQVSGFFPAQQKPLDLVHSQDEKDEFVSPQVDESV